MKKIYNKTHDESAPKNATFPIVLKEERLLYSDYTKCFVTVSLKHGGTDYEGQRISSEKITQKECFTQHFGFKPFHYFEKADWTAFFNRLKTQFNGIDQVTVYYFNGWIENNACYIWGNKAVKSNSVDEISNKTIKERIQIPDINEQVICNDIHIIIANLFATPLIGYVSHLYMFLGILKQRLYDSKRLAPEFIVMLEGKTGSYKTSVSKALFNPLGLTSCSFEDSEPAIRKTFQDICSGTLIVDDYKCHNTENAHKVESITRMAGDITTGAKRVSGDTVKNRTSTATALITGEVRPQLQASSYARILFIDLNAYPVHIEYLSKLQNSMEKYVAFTIYFIQYIMQQKDFDNDFAKKLNTARDALIMDSTYKGMHGRYYEMYAWFAAMWQYYVEYLNKNGLNAQINFEEEIKKYILCQHRFYDNNPVRLFQIGFCELKSQNMLFITDRSSVTDAKFDALDLGTKLYIKSGNIYAKVCKYWNERGISFPCSERALRKELFNKGWLIKQNDKMTREIKVLNNISISGYYIYKNLFLRGIDYEQ